MNYYQIFPEKLGHISISANERSNVRGISEGIGCLLFGIFYLILCVSAKIVISKEKYYGPIFVICMIISIVLVFSFSKWKRHQNISKFVDEKRNRELQRRQQEAESIAQRLRNLLSYSVSREKELSLLLENALTSLRHAEIDFEANAFGPFWDAIEDATKYLATFSRNIDIITNNANQYYQTLRGKQHSFPVFPVQFSAIPNPKPIVNELSRITRKGQTNFHFANIWEHRRTRDVLIEGFSTLQETINNIGSVLEHALDGFHNTVSSEFSRVVEEEIKIRKTVDIYSREQITLLREQDKKLTDIQKIKNK